jgi:hypothetical protein
LRDRPWPNGTKRISLEKRFVAALSAVRMSEAICASLGGQPGYRFAHPGYACYSCQSMAPRGEQESPANETMAQKAWVRPFHCHVGRNAARAPVSIVFRVDVPRDLRRKGPGLAFLRETSHCVLVVSHFVLFWNGHAHGCHSLFHLGVFF